MGQKNLLVLTLVDKTAEIFNYCVRTLAYTIWFITSFGCLLAWTVAKLRNDACTFSPFDPLRPRTPSAPYWTGHITAIREILYSYVQYYIQYCNRIKGRTLVKTIQACQSNANMFIQKSYLHTTGARITNRTLWTWRTLERRNQYII